MESSKPSIIMLQSAIGLIFGYLTFLIIFRYAGVEAYGIFSFALSFGLLFSFIGDLGLNTAHIKMISSGKNRAEYNSAFFLLKISMTLIYIGVMLLSLYIWKIVLHRGFETRFELISILLLIPYFFSLPLIQGIRSFLTGTMEAAKLSIPSIVESLVRFLLIFIFFLVNIFHIRNSLEYSIYISIAYSASYMVYLAMNLYFGRPWKFKWPDFSIIMEYMKFSFPLLIATVVATISSNISQILIQTFFHAYELGGYSGDLKIVQIISTFAGSITIMILPMLAKDSKDMNEYKGRVNYITKYLIMLLSPLIVFTIIFAAPILNLWTSQLISFQLPLKVMLLSIFFSVVSTTFINHFNATSNTKVSSFINILNSVLIIVLDIILIPSQFFGIKLMNLGVMGAALAMLISSIITFLYSLFLIHNEIGKFIDKNAVLPIAVSILPALPLIIFFYNSTRMSALYLAAIFVGYMFIYLILLRAFKVINRDELNDIINIINPKKLFSYIADELRRPSQ